MTHFTQPCPLRWSVSPQRTRPRVPSSRGWGQDADDAEMRELAAELEVGGGGPLHSATFFTTVQHAALPRTHGLRRGPAPRPLGPPPLSQRPRRRGGGGSAITTSSRTRSANRLKYSRVAQEDGGGGPRPRPASRGERCWISLEVVVHGTPSFNASTVSPVQHRSAVQSASGLPRQRRGPTPREAFAGGNAGQFDGGFSADSFRADDASALLSFGRGPPSPRVRTHPYARAWQHHSSHQLLGTPGEPESLLIHPTNVITNEPTLLANLR